MTTVARSINMDDQLILVDLNDRPTGAGEKLWTHQNDRLHRAFSVFVVWENKMLLQRRARDKYHSGGLWANACCSHPRVGEDLEQAVSRRLREELGIQNAPAEELFSFVYRTDFGELTEFEYDHVLLARYGGAIAPDPEEIEETRWTDLSELKQDILERPGAYASWFLIAAPKVLDFLET